MRTLSVLTWIGNAVAVLGGGWGAVTAQTQAAGCSRQAAYDHARRVEQAVAEAQQPGPCRAALAEALSQADAENRQLWQALEQAVDFPVAKQQQFAALAAALGLSLNQTESLLAVLLSSGVATTLGLSLPFPRQMQISGMGGVQTAAVSFPPDGLVSLVVTDYRECAYLPRPLVGFHALSGGTTSQRSVLGLTGFLQHFRFVLDLPANPPVFELDPQAGFPGSTGTLTAGQPLADFLTSLRGTA